MLCPPRRSIDPRGRSAPSKRRPDRSRGVLSCARAAVVARPGCALVCVRTRLDVLSDTGSLHACCGPGIERQLRALHGGAPGPAGRPLRPSYRLRRRKRHGHWPEHTGPVLRMILTVKASIYLSLMAKRPKCIRQQTKYRSHLYLGI